MEDKKIIMVVDAQGGGLGKQLITGIRKEIGDVRIIAIGTNSTASANMLKAGADEAATGENSIRVVSKKADVIVGPIGMVIADSMLGEITADMSVAIAKSDAKRIFIPFNNCDNYIVGISDLNIAGLVTDAVNEIKKIVTL
jgi:hypothetical protein